MKVMFIGADNFWAEGLKYVLEESFAEPVKLVTVQTDIDCNYEVDILYDRYELVFIDLMSYDSVLYRNLNSLLNNMARKIVFIHSLNSSCINFHANWVDKQITISKDIALKKMSAELMAPCAYDTNKFNSRNHNQSGFRRTHDVMNAFELEVIRSISTGEKVKSVAKKMNKSDKTIYQLLSRMKLRMGFKSKHEFLFFLTTFNSYESEQ
ncbi:hypothetical protein JW319_06395 [Enterobacter cloacae subsp. cloacae]|uniref:helix-turn-helix transcriptional regulator n=1 Tax=Enterobacter cloacae TaxID=550 RepID=UPI0018C3167A|nr:LuxR C-terminal-related transcriptional regulator [Enterobacter cloacae]MBG0524636.1 hypothetical protein [Enterobacter cloacae]MBW4201003.1 hypothetical protein [Enterobacter cloacae subsp. cloacae]